VLVGAGVEVGIAVAVGTGVSVGAGIDVGMGEWIGDGVAVGQCMRVLLDVVLAAATETAVADDWALDAATPAEKEGNLPANGMPRLLIATVAPAPASATTRIVSTSAARRPAPLCRADWATLVGWLTEAPQRGQKRSPNRSGPRQFGQRMSRLILILLLFR